MLEMRLKQGITVIRGGFETEATSQSGVMHGCKGSFTNSIELLDALTAQVLEARIKLVLKMTLRIFIRIWLA
jgi:hypothetical protein